ncbi:MAG: glycosyltransferase family 2 protein [Flavobacteriaceae bacterium]|nr:glycosyltransferase family 2 protein [Flavobacteriaceae bacterium]
MNKISIIIPILNEAEYIGRLLDHLHLNSTPNNIADIIVVDGGSTDASKNIVGEFENVILLESEKGRAKQMNFGARKANGNILYFLHADSFPPKNFDSLIIKEIENGNQAGCFRMSFDHDHWWLRLASWLTQFKWRACRGGDQSQYISKTLFNELGGFDESYIIYEDNDLINKLYARKEFTVISEKLTTSARCYRKNGIWRLQYHFWTIYVKKWFGASAEEIHRYYKKNII